MKLREEISLLKLDREQVKKELSAKIINNELKYKNTVIIGENGVGKTDLLESLGELKEAVLIKCQRRGDIIKSIDTKAEIILIDNIEVSLDMEDIYEINSYLNKMFVDKKIIVTTHNLELISRLKDYNIINMKKKYYGIYDGNDFDTYNAVRNIIACELDEREELLVTLANLKLSDNWTEVEEEKLKELIDSGISDKEKLLLGIF